MKKRFYDQDPTVAQAVSLLLVFPDEMQTFIAESLGDIAEKDFGATELLQNLKSLGSDTVLSIYKSKQKSRQYDQNPSVHRSMNYLLILPPEDRVQLAKKLVELMGFLQEYLQTCKTLTLTPNPTTVEQLAKCYVQNGPTGLQALLEGVKQELTQGTSTEDGNGKRHQPVLQQPVSPDDAEPPAPRLREAITDGGQGMKIKGDFL